MGGIVRKDGAALRYGGNLPNEEWLRCCLSFLHIRNRLPSKSCRHPTRVPLEAYEGVDYPPDELVKEFRVLGCLCYVVVPHNLRVGKPKLSYRAVMLGYSNHSGQKGYVVRNLRTGKVGPAAHNQVTFYESKLVFPRESDYDAWLRKRLKRGSYADET